MGLQADPAEREAFKLKALNAMTLKPEGVALRLRSRSLRQSLATHPPTPTPPPPTHHHHPHVSERDVEVTWPAGAERPVASETARTDEEINREEAGQDAEEEQGKRYRRKGDATEDICNQQGPPYTDLSEVVSKPVPKHDALAFERTFVRNEPHDSRRFVFRKAIPHFNDCILANPDSYTTF